MTITKNNKTSRCQSSSLRKPATAVRRPAKPTERLIVAPDTDALVSVNSRVRLTDLASGRSRTCTIVEPENTAVVPDGISVTVPLGAALVGCQVGDVVRCWELTRFRELRIAEIE